MRRRQDPQPQRPPQSPPCLHCRRDPGRRIVLVLAAHVRPDGTLHEDTREYACRCDCDAGAHYQGLPDWMPVADRFRGEDYIVDVTDKDRAAWQVRRSMMGLDARPAPVPMASPEEMARDMREPPRRSWHESEGEWETGEVSV